MKLLINTTNLSRGGGMQVAITFILSCREFNDNDYCVLVSPLIKEQLRGINFSKNFSFILVKDKPIPYTYKGIKTIALLNNLERDYNPDCVFTVFGPTYWKPKSPHLMGFAMGHFIYSDSPFFKTISKKEKVIWYIKKVIKMIYIKRESNHYHVETEDAKIRLIKLLNSPKKHVHVLSNTYNPLYDTFQPKLTDFILPINTEKEFRFACITSYYKHKNLEIINKIAPLLDEANLNVKFILTIRNEIFETLFTNIAKKYVINLGPINIEECPQVYFECEAVFVPTLLEIFTANYPEAMKMGKPILTSDLSFSRSICLDSALYYKNDNISDLIKKISILINDVSLQEKLIFNGKKRLDYFLSPREKTSQILKICKSIS